MNDGPLKKYRKRIIKEGVLKSLFIGLMLGCVGLAITAFLSWFFGYKPGLFIALAVCAAITGIVTPLVYFFKYRPSVKTIAKRIDALGLEERMLTMTELEGDDSYIAKTQREDTMRVLGAVNHMLLKIAVSAAIIVPLVICCLLGAGMTTVSSLYYADVIPSGIVTLSVPYTPSIFTVTYSVEPNITVDEEGNESSSVNGTVIYWTGDWTAETPVSEEGDKVIEGNDARPVYAIPNDGYVFVSWSDGYSNPYRQDKVVDSDIFVQAIFEPMDPDPDQQQSESQAQDQQNGGGGEQGDQQQNGSGESDQSQEGEPQEGEPNDQESESDNEQESDSNSDKDDQNQGKPSGDPNKGDGAGGSRDLGSQQIVDGNTYYGDEYDDAYSSWQDRESADSNLPDDLKDFIEDYYGSIETGKSNNSGSEGGSGGEGGNGGTDGDGGSESGEANP